MLLTGSAGGGKSHLAANKLHGYLLKYPRSQGLAARKIQASLANSTVLYLENEVIGNDPRVVHRPSKSRFEYYNGSMLIYVGLEDVKQRRRLRSIGLKGGVDIAWMEEGTEFERADFDAVKARMRGKAAHWRQIIISTNPEGPTHWIYTGLIMQAGNAAVYYSKAVDNPYNPEDYQTNLESMQGVEGVRLRDGLWVQSTGLVYAEWNDSENVTESADYEPGAGPLFWGVDDGYTGEFDSQAGMFTGQSHPRVFLLAQLRNDGSLNVFWESLQIKTLSEIHLDEVLALPYPEPDFAACDKSAAELRGRIHARGLYTRKSPASVAESIKELRNWVSADKNGVRRLKVHPRCKQLRLEFVTYAYNPSTGVPLKEFDHCMDSLRYLVHALRDRG